MTDTDAVPLTRVTPESLRAFVHDLLRAMGLPEEEATIFGGALIFSELRFHPGHGQGVKKLRRYAGRFSAGAIDPTAEWEIVKESPALALVDAHNGIGTVAASRLPHEATGDISDTPRQKDAANTLVTVQEVFLNGPKP